MLSILKIQKRMEVKYSSMSIKKKTVPDNMINLDEEYKYKCLICGKEVDNPDRVFYKSPWSVLFKQNNQYVPWCVDCLKEMFKNYENKFGTEMATILLCHKLDVPFYFETFRSTVSKNQTFGIGTYLRLINGRQYQYKTFDQTILEKELNKNNEDIRASQESKWSKEEITNKNKVIDLVGYDPFESYNEADRKYLFNELINFFDDDIEDDRYKLSQIVQIVTNNVQIRNCDICISKMNPLADSKDIKELNNIKKDLVSANDKIAKENEISVKNRSNKEAGKSTLTHYMKELREMNFDKAEADYYDQLRSEGTRWANDISTQSLFKHSFLDENDKKEIFENNYMLLQKTTEELDDAKEEIRLLKKKVDSLTFENKDLREKLPEKDVK